MEHTKAPWAWQNFGEETCLTAQHGLREIIIGANVDRNKVGIAYASMNNNGRLERINPEHPNAKLIAAAPDLLEALIQAEKLLDVVYESGMVRDAPLSRAGIKAAINKATQ